MEGDGAVAGHAAPGWPGARWERRLHAPVPHSLCAGSQQEAGGGGGGEEEKELEKRRELVAFLDVPRERRTPAQHSMVQVPHGPDVFDDVSPWTTG